MDFKLNLPNTKCSDWNDLFSHRYHRMFRISDIDEWGMQDKRMTLIKKQIQHNKEYQSLEIDETNFVVPEKKTLAIRGLGYWVGTLQWDRANGTTSNTVISGKLSKYWLSAPIAVLGLALSLWFFKDFIGFLKPIANNSAIFLVSVLLVTALIGILNYFAHYFAVKSILKQLTVFLKYKGISYEFGSELYDAEKTMEEAKLEFEKSLRDTEVAELEKEKSWLDAEPMTTDYVPETIVEDSHAELIKTQLEDEESYHIEIAESESEIYDVDTASEEYERDVDAITEDYDIQATEEEAAYEEEDELEPWTGSVSSYEEPGDKLETAEDEEVFVEAKDFDEDKSGRIKLMHEGFEQTVEMKGVDEFDNEIEGGIKFGGDSAYQVAGTDDYDDDNEDAYDIGDAEATRIGDVLISPDDAFAQGFSPQIMSEEELSMPEVNNEEAIDIDEDFEVPEISEEYEEYDEDVDEYYQGTETMSDVEETETDVSEALDKELIEDEYTIDDVDDDEDTGFGQEFEKTQEEDSDIADDAEIVEFTDSEYSEPFTRPESEIDNVFTQAMDEQEISDVVDEETSEDSEIVEFTDSEYSEPFSRPESEISDDVEMPVIAEQYESSKTLDDFTESDIPDEYMESEITQDMGVADADIDIPEDEMEIEEAEVYESEIFEVPNIATDSEETDLPEDFGTPSFENEDDGFEDATEYVVHDFADEDNDTNIKSYDDEAIDDYEIEETSDDETDKDIIVDEEYDGPTEISRVEEIIGDNVEIFDAEKAFAGDTEFFDDVEEIVDYEDSDATEDDDEDYDEDEDIEEEADEDNNESW